jgi:hypothetical protein
MAETQINEKLSQGTHLHSEGLLSSGGPRKESVGSSWYDHFVAQLATLIPRFGLESQLQQVIAAFEMILRESLATPYNCPPPNFSRINFDGIPLQYSLALGAFEPALQFIGEASIPGSSTAARLKVSKERISTLIELLDIESSSFALSELLDETVPEADQDLLWDPAGALWLSPTFSPDRKPKLTIYINAKWGADHKRRRRLDRFASILGAEEQWRKFEELAYGQMSPLGAAVTLTADSRPTGRIYLSAFGKTVDYYASLARAMTAASFDQLLGRYASITLGEDCKYPTQSAVCSIGLDSVEEPDLKFELCGHCAFASDVEARSKCLDWLAFQNVDPTPYLLVLDTLSENRLGSTASTLHAYVGIGLKRGQPYSTIYLKPNAIRKGYEHRV